jgi:hypothetical protein
VRSVNSGVTCSRLQDERVGNTTILPSLLTREPLVTSCQGTAGTYLVVASPGVLEGREQAKGTGLVNGLMAAVCP